MIWILFISGVMLTVYILISIYVGYRSLYWPFVLGRVKHSFVAVRVNKTLSSKNKYYHPDVVYEYEVNNKKYTNNKIGNYLFFGNNRGYAEKIINSFTESSEVKVHYCPYYKGLSVLNPGMNQVLAHSILLFAGVVIILGSYPVLFTENPEWFIEKIFGVIEYVT